MNGVEGLPTDEEMREVIARVAGGPRLLERCLGALAYMRANPDGVTELFIGDPNEKIGIMFHSCDADDCECLAVRIHQRDPGRAAGC